MQQLDQTSFPLRLPEAFTLRVGQRCITGLCPIRSRQIAPPRLRAHRPGISDHPILIGSADISQVQDVFTPTFHRLLQSQRLHPDPGIETSHPRFLRQATQTTQPKISDFFYRNHLSAHRIQMNVIHHPTNGVIILEHRRNESTLKQMPRSPRKRLNRVENVDCSQCIPPLKFPRGVSIAKW